MAAYGTTGVLAEAEVAEPNCLQVHHDQSTIREITMGSKDKRKESKGKKPQPKPVPAGK
ncbi:hypothetical protein GALL_21760 [mine drainage metagenome]|uniref:Uncharacterized protein n=1 Tax=mine drainage metagenome TaxID=410659 RepID=A0A1J5TAK4_9ZZZZ